MEVRSQRCLCFFFFFLDDPVYMPLESQKREYIKSDYGMVYMGSHLNITKRPWLFGQVCDT